MSRRVSIGMRTCGAFLAILALCAPQASAQSLSGGWTTADIGSVSVKGSSSISGSTVVVNGAGHDIWGAADAFRFTYKTLKGDGTIISQVSSVERADVWTKAGVMMRDSLSANSRHASMFVSAGKGLAFQRRKSPGGTTYHTSGANKMAPYYVRVSRTGDSFKAYTSADGSNWTHVGTTTIAMGETIYVGLAVTSHNARSAATARFTSIKISGGTGAAATPTTSGPSAPPPPAAAPSASSSTLRVLHWNTHHGGVGTDGKYDPARLVSYIVKAKPDIVSLNEVDNASLASTIVSLMKSKTGTSWGYHYDNRGNVVMTRLPILDKSTCVVNSGAGRKATQISTRINGRTINFWSAHLAVSGSGTRVSETKALQSCQNSWAEARIAAGDFNMQAGSAEYNSMTARNEDAWAKARSLKTTKNYSSNCDGCTRNSRIDYVFTSKGASALTLRSAEILDTRDSRGKMPSDHKPMLVVYSVK